MKFLRIFLTFFILPALLFSPATVHAISHWFEPSHIHMHYGDVHQHEHAQENHHDIAPNPCDAVLLPGPSSVQELGFYPSFFYGNGSARAWDSLLIQQDIFKSNAPPLKNSPLHFEYSLSNKAPPA